jgi:uncharacterized protein (TIGR02246 family)
MRTITKVFLLLSIVWVSSNLTGCRLSVAPTSQTLTEQEVLDLFNNWNDVLQTGDPHQVAALYSYEATLLPTVSNKVRHNHEEIADYFEHFLELDPTGTINESNIRVFDGLAMNSGIYTFSVKVNDSISEVQARFSFVYELIDGDWLIIAHHSSAMPEH